MWTAVVHLFYVFKWCLIFDMLIFFKRKIINESFFLLRKKYIDWMCSDSLTQVLNVNVIIELFNESLVFLELWSKQNNLG